jgi:HAD superfamily hydrolase (TIGR01662 family)
MKDRAILIDRDGTLIAERSESRDPNKVELMPRAGDALALAREWDWIIGVVSVQADTAPSDREADLFRLHARIEQLAGPIDGWFVCICPDGTGEMPREPDLITAAAHRFGVAVERCVVVGDIGADVEAAHAAGAQAVLVPTSGTRRDDIDAAPVVAGDLLEAVRRIVAGAL